VIYYCFDWLYFAGVDLRKSAYRIAVATGAMPVAPRPGATRTRRRRWRCAAGGRARERLRRRHRKRKDSRYEAGRRSASWLKIKPVQTAEFVIGGYTKGKGSRRRSERCWSALGQGIGCASPRTWAPLRREHTGAVEEAAGTAEALHLPVRRDAGAAQCDDLG